MELLDEYFGQSQERHTLARTAIGFGTLNKQAVAVFWIWDAIAWKSPEATLAKTLSPLR